MSGRGPGRDAAVTTVVGRLRARRARRTRRRVIRSAAVAATVLLVLGGGGWVVLGSPVLALRTVTVEGVGRVTVDQVLRQAGLSPGTSLVLVDTSAVGRRVGALAPVDHVQVIRHWPHSLVIRVVERRPAAVVLASGAAVLIDRHGVAFATDPHPPRGLVAVDVDGAVPGPGAPGARAAVQVLDGLPPALRHRVRRMSAPTPDAVTFELSGGQQVVWGSATGTARKVAVLRALLRRQQAGRYDVSAPDVAVTG